MNPNLKLKLLTDLSLTISMLLAFAYHLTGSVAHEIIGLSMFILLAAHNALNWRWYGSLAKSVGPPRRRLAQAVTLVLLSVTLVLFISGVLLSIFLFDFIRVDNSFLARRFHTLAAYWTLVLMSVHVGLHWPMIMAVLGRALGLTGPSRLRTAVFRLAALGIMLAGTYFSFERGLGSKLLMRRSFDYWEGSAAGFFAAYLLIMGLYIALTHYGLKIFRGAPTPRAGATMFNARNMTNIPEDKKRPRPAGEQKSLICE